MAVFKHLDTAALPKNWDADFFGNLVDFKLGKTPPRGNSVYWKEGKYPWVSISDMLPHGIVYETSESVSQEAYDKVFRRKLIPEGSLLMSFKLTIGRISRLGIPAFHNEAIISFQPDRDTLDDDFIRYYLSQINYKDYQDTAIKGQTLNKGKLNSLEIALPPLPEQKKIAYILSTVQRAIEAQERIIQTTTELKKALMQKLFTEGLRNEPQKQTEVGPVPESWEVVPLSSTIRSKLQNGAFVKKPETGVGYLFANVVDMYRETHLDLTQLERLNVEPSEIERYWLEDGDVLVVRSSLKREGIGQNCVARNLYEPVFYDCHLIRVQTKNDKLLPEFLSYYWRSDIGKGDLVLRSKTTTMTTINQQGISKALIPVAPIEEQEQIVKHLGLLDQKAMKHREKRNALQDLFRTLLHELMTAKIRVKKLELGDLKN